MIFGKFNGFSPKSLKMDVKIDRKSLNMGILLNVGEGGTSLLSSKDSSYLGRTARLYYVDLRYQQFHLGGQAGPILKPCHYRLLSSPKELFSPPKQYLLN